MISRRQALKAGSPPLALLLVVGAWNLLDRIQHRHDFPDVP